MERLSKYHLRPASVRPDWPLKESHQMTELEYCSNRTIGKDLLRAISEFLRHDMLRLGDFFYLVRRRACSALMVLLGKQFEIQTLADVAG